MANTNDELAALSAYFKPLLPTAAKVVLQNWPASPAKQTLVIRSLPDEITPIASGLMRTIRSYQVLYVDDRVDKVQAVVDEMKFAVASATTVPVNAQTRAFLRVNQVVGGKAFKTEGSSPLDGAHFTIQCTSHTARSSEIFETMQHASIGFN